MNSTEGNETALIPGGEAAGEAMSTVQIASTLSIALLVLVNLSGNLCCLLVLLKHRKINMATKLFLSSMTSSDLCFAIFTQLPSLGVFITNGWPFGDVVCQISGIGYDILLTTGSLSLFAVNTDRFIAVMRPLRYHDIVTDFRAKISVVSIWIFAFFCAIILGFSPGRSIQFNNRYLVCKSGVTKPPPPANHTYSSNILHRQLSDRLRGTWLILVCYTPILLTLIMFIRVFAIARRHQRQISAQDHHNQRQNKSNHKAFNTCFLMTVCLLISTLPLAIDNAYTYITGDHLPLSFGAIANQAFNVYAISNIVIYYARNKDFRTEATTLLLRLNCFKGIL